ncbi:CBS domain-containing protein [Nannocystis pusilla]|uniref:CBS domain-containing protein n=1 Tax=Nannocystis pusilla TaxID=889268 RepID=UPI003DA490EA
MSPSPVIIDGGLTLSDAAARMFQIHARHLPVYTSGHLVGILSDRDIAQMATYRGLDPDKCTAEQACSPNPYVCDPEAPLEEVAQTMADHKYGAVLVMRDGALLGILTVVDALQALAGQLRCEEARRCDPQHDWTVIAVGRSSAIVVKEPGTASLSEEARPSADGG